MRTTKNFDWKFAFSNDLAVDRDKTEVIATMGDYSIVKGWTSAFGEGEFQYIELYKDNVVLAHDYYSRWLEHPSIEYWMKEYIDLAYKQYQAKFEQVEELIKEAQFIEEDILDVSNVLDYYRGFKKEGD